MNENSFENIVCKMVAILQGWGGVGVIYRCVARPHVE